MLLKGKTGTALPEGYWHAVALSMALPATGVLQVAIKNVYEIDPLELARPIFILSLTFGLLSSIIGVVGRIGPFIGLSFSLLLYLNFHLISFVTFLLDMGVIWRGISEISVRAIILTFLIAPLFICIIFRDFSLKFLTFFTSVVTLYTVGLFISEFTSHRFEVEKAEKVISDMRSRYVQNFIEHPDIIYIVPDRYGNNQSMNMNYGFFEDKLLDFLSNNNFYVFSESISNYVRTSLSMASSLNLDYLENVHESTIDDPMLVEPYYDLLSDNLVERTLKNEGYHYIHMGNWWRPNRYDTDADEEVYGSEIGAWLTEADEAVIDTAFVLRSVVHRPDARDECRRLLNQLDFLEQFAGGDGPTYIHAHLTIPHPPVVIAEDGTCLDEEIRYPAGGTSWKEYSEAVLGYAQFLDRRLSAIVAAQLERTNGNIVIVIQADEGPWPREYYERRREFDWFETSPENIAIKYGILNAIHLPSRHYDRAYPTMSAVNVWRLVFSELTGMEMELLEDRLILSRTFRRANDMRDYELPH